MVRTDDRELLANLSLLEMQDLDVILGTDWLSTYHASVVVTFQILSQQIFHFRGTKEAPRPHLVSKLIIFFGKDVTVFVHVNWGQEEKLNLKNVLVIREFSDVFPEKLPGLPPRREVDFLIKLFPRTTPFF